MLLKDIPYALIESFAEKRLILFVGAGISVGSGLPPGRELAFQLQNELFKNRFDDVRPSPEAPPPLEIVAQRYQIAFGRQKLNDFLLRTFHKDGLLPNEAHKTAARLFTHIITTNFDALLEDAVKEQGRYPIVVVRDLQLPNISIPDRTIIYKLHGEISTPDRIVITQRDYTRVPLTDGIRNELRAMLSTKGVVFVGYSLGDPDFLRQLDFCRGILGQAMLKSYAVVPGAEKDVLFVKQCDEDNIDLISDTAVDFFHDLEQALERQVAVPIPLPTRVALDLPEVERRYRESICEEFKWIDFKGIPVLGGYLRVPIDELFVFLSASPYQGLKSESLRQRTRGSRLRSKRAMRSSLLEQTREGRSIFEIIRKNTRLVILGDPGSGKSTLLRYIGYQLTIPEPQPSKIGLEKPYLPVHIPLREYAAFRKTRPGVGIATFLPELFKVHNLAAFSELVLDAIHKGRALLLFDGLDEVASQEERLRVSADVQEFSGTCSDCRLLVTSRKVGYPKAPLRKGFANVVVEPLTDPDIQTFIELWCKATDTEKEKASLLEAISNPRVRALAENPLLITILARVYKAYRNLPERRAGLYAKCVEALLTTWDLMRDVPPVFQDVREANRIMGPIALWVHRDRGGQLVTKEELTRKLAELGDLPGQQQPSSLVSQIEERSGLLKEVGLNQYAFTHLTFQEYYVAREIVSKGDVFKQVSRFLGNDRWQEAIILAAGLLDDLGKAPVTAFLNSFVTRYTARGGKKARHLVKLNLLIGCLKDKVEPDPHIETYVHKSLLDLAETSRVPLYRLVSTRLTQLPGLAKTKVGCRILGDLRTALKEPARQASSNNLVFLGFNMFKDELDRARFMISAFGDVADLKRFPVGALVYTSRTIESLKDTALREELIREARTVPLVRRQSGLERVGLMGYAPYIKDAINIWTAPEERSTLSRALRARVKGK